MVIYGYNAVDQLVGKAYFNVTNDECRHAARSLPISTPGVRLLAVGKRPASVPAVAAATRRRARRITRIHMLV